MSRFLAATGASPDPRALEIYPLLLPVVDLSRILAQTFQHNSVEWSGVTAGGTDGAAITITEDGYYLVFATVGSMTNLGGARDILFHVTDESGTAVLEERTILSTTAGDGDHFGPFWLYLKRNAIVRLRLNTAMLISETIDTSLNTIRHFVET